MPGPVLVDSHPFTVAPPEPGAPAPTLLIEHWRFENGLTLLFGRDPSTPVFAYQTWFDVGSCNETPGKTGIAHLFEHLMFKRTQNHAEGELDRVIETRGGSSNAATWVDWTYYTSGLPQRGDNFEVVAEFEADRMVSLVLDEAQVEAEREVVLNERSFRVDNVPDGKMSEQLYSRAFTRHPYHWPTIGWEADIRAITIPDCEQFYRTWYAPNNATLVVIGDLDGARVRETIAKRYGSIARQTLPTEAFATDAVPGNVREEMRLAIEGEKLLTGWRIPALTSPDRTVLSVIESILFHGKSSRARRRLVDDLAIAVDAGSMATPFKYDGVFEVKVDLAEGHAAEEAERELAALTTRLATEDVPDAELSKSVNLIQLSFFAGLGSASDKAESLGLHHLTAGDYRRLFSEVARIAAVTPADIRRVASSVFRPENNATIVGRPE